MHEQKYEVSIGKEGQAISLLRLGGVFMDPTPVVARFLWTHREKFGEPAAGDCHCEHLNSMVLVAMEKLAEHKENGFSLPCLHPFGPPRMPGG